MMRKCHFNEHFRELDKFVHELKCASAEVKESEAISMPECYDSVCTMIKMRGEDISLDFVQKELLEFEPRRNQKKSDKKKNEYVPTAFVGN